MNKKGIIGDCGNPIFRILFYLIILFFLFALVIVGFNIVYVKGVEEINNRIVTNYYGDGCFVGGTYPDGVIEYMHMGEVFESSGNTFCCVSWYDNCYKLQGKKE